eukprot:scaffold11769_cov97-Isochrysis_galbana.AAC.2
MNQILETTNLSEAGIDTYSKVKVENRTLGRSRSSAVWPGRATSPADAALAIAPAPRIVEDAQ